VKMLISLIRKINESGSVTEDALIRLSDMIDRFNQIETIKK
jgi:pilus assembly protein TadC